MGSGSRGLWIGLGLFSCGLIVGGFAVSKLSTPHSLRHDSNEGGEDRLPLAVQVAHVVLKDKQAFNETTGEVQSETTIQISSRIVAKILNVHVNADDRVKVDDLLISLDDDDLKRQLHQAESTYQQAQAVYVEALTEGDRTRKLFEQKIVTLQNLQRTERDTKTAAADVQRTRSQVSEAQVRLDFASIRSPIDGIVADKLGEQGEMAIPGKSLLEIHDPRSLRFQAMVPEACFDKVSKGMPMLVRLTLHPDPIQTTVSEIVPRIDPQSRKFPVRVSLPRDLPLSPGTFGYLQMPCGPGKLMAIPASAVVRRGHLDTVFVVDSDNVAKLRIITLGQTFDVLSQVLTGLTVGDLLVVDPPSTLRDGRHVVVDPKIHPGPSSPDDSARESGQTSDSLTVSQTARDQP